MYNIKEIVASLVFGLRVANFLLITDRVHKAFEIFNECLILVCYSTQGREDPLNQVLSCEVYSLIFIAYLRISDYTNAEICGRKLLVSLQEFGEKVEEGKVSMALGEIYECQNKFTEAKQLYEKAINIMIQAGQKKEEARAYEKLGNLFCKLSIYAKAKEYIDRALEIRIDISDRAGEARCYGSLGIVFQTLYKYVKAKEYLGKALAIMIEIGDITGEASCYGNLGNVFQSLGEYVKAKEYQEKALAIIIETGDRAGEASCNFNLGIIFESLGEYVKAKECHEKALAISIEIGDRAGEASCYVSVGGVLTSLVEYVKAKEYLEKALAIMIEIGDIAGEASCYGNLGNVFKKLGKFIKAKEYTEKALAIKTEIGDRKGEATACANLGFVFRSLGEYKAANECFEKALSISRDIGRSDIELGSLFGYALSNLNQKNFENAVMYLFEYIGKLENSRMSLGVNDQFKTSYFERHGAFPYALMSRLLSDSGTPLGALFVSEMGRARGLAELMGEQYSVQVDVPFEPLSSPEIEYISRKEGNCTCLYISYDLGNVVNLWILKPGGNNHFKQVSVNQTDFVQAGLDRNLTMSLFLNESFRSLGYLSEEHCEDRSLIADEPQCVSPEQKSSVALRLVEEDDDFIEEILSLSFCYKIFIAPVDYLLTEPEVIIVPHKSVYKVPFAALCDKEGTYLSETSRIRIVPSLTTLKLIQDSPADYHSQTGALIVGDPKVGWVTLKGRRDYVTSLPCARKEAERVARLVGVTPLLGEEATRQAVFEKITSVSLIHFAAHGNAERGEIALSPIRTPNSTDIAPPEEEYLLTMSDIPRIKITPKLVVLSCCHSARGQIRAEGVIGIARAFLGSGARSVLVALWAINDTATKQLMNRFYEHVVSGESASESLHQAMKWMRNNGFTKVSEWAPFMLIGDNVTFEYGK